MNVLVSGFPEIAGVPNGLINRWIQRRFILVLSEHIMTVLADVWGRPYWRNRYQASEALRALALLRTRASIVKPSDAIRGVCEDEEDDLVLATAVAGKADFLVTGDKFLQAIGRYENVTILSLRQFLDLLEEAAAPTT